MKLAKDPKGLSKVALLLLLIVFFLSGAILSYVWTMGSYAPNEFSLPSQQNLTIENIKFYPDYPDFFDMTVLNPSYSPSSAKIEQINVHTSDDKFHAVTTTLPELSSLSIAPGESETIKSYWNWANYTDQKVDVYVILAEGSGPAVEVKTAFMNLTVANIVFEPSITSTRFNITVESRGSPVSVDIDKITVNGANVTDTTPALPCKIDPNATVTFTIRRDWTDLQNQTVTVAVQTRQGYMAMKSATSPQTKINISNVVFFNTTATSFYFNMTVENSAVSSAKVDITSIKLFVESQNITLDDVSIDPRLSQTLSPGSTLLLKCTWNWSQFTSKSVIVTVYTAQGFNASTKTTIPNIP